MVLADGDLAAFVERGGRRILTFPGADPQQVAAAVAAMPSAKRHVIATIDGDPAGATRLGRALRDAGFVESYKGLARP